jgi:hypothetical protein
MLTETRTRPNAAHGCFQDSDAQLIEVRASPADGLSVGKKMQDDHLRAVFVIATLACINPFQPPRRVYFVSNDGSCNQNDMLLQL